MRNVKGPEHCLLLNVGVVARGSRCLSIMRDLNTIRSSHLRLKLVGIATISLSAACNKYAGETGVELFENPKDLLSIQYLDLILDFSGDPVIMAELITSKPPTIGVLDRHTAMMFFDIATLYDKMTKRETEINLAPVLITGETGVGKDLVARVIQQQSQRSEGPFISINCGALAESLLESELFGHERGAFTGAVKAKRGRLEMAHQGTLFLDEIGEISSKMQISLLQAIEEKQFLRVGGSRSIRSDFRLISATHQNLPRLIKEKRFREDFYYRINVIGLEIPPLRERLEDVPVLADHFLKHYVEETGKFLEGFTQRAIGMLTSYHWPGNVRELRNVIERAVVIAKGRMIGAKELSFLDPGSDICHMGPLTLKEMEMNHIRSSLDTCDWNVSRTAKQLGIDRSTLARKIRKYQLIRS